MTDRKPSASATWTDPDAPPVVTPEEAARLSQESGPDLTGMKHTFQDGLDDSTAMGDLAVIFAIFAALAVAVLLIIGGAVLIVGLPS
jgi:hypothetical protein